MACTGRCRWAGDGLLRRQSMLGRWDERFCYATGREAMGGASEPGPLGRSSSRSRRGGRMLRLRRWLVIRIVARVEVDLSGHCGRLHGLVLCLLGPHHAHPVGNSSNLCAGAAGCQMGSTRKALHYALGMCALRGNTRRDWHAPRYPQRGAWLWPADRMVRFGLANGSFTPIHIMS